jgi:uncharacterized protein (DUF302 family)
MEPMHVTGMVHLRSRYTVAETLRRLEAEVTAHGLKIFDRIDHSGEAERAGFEMRPTQVLVFGSPKAGTPLMVAAPTLAIDLPLKALIWEDAGGAVWLSYNSPEYLQQRHGVPEALVKNIAGAAALYRSAAES